MRCRLGLRLVEMVGNSRSGGKERTFDGPPPFVVAILVPPILGILAVPADRNLASRSDSAEQLCGSQAANWQSSQGSEMGAGGILSRDRGGEPSGFERESACSVSVGVVGAGLLGTRAIV